MEHANRLLIVVDAGHGGYDNGAAWQGRPEKDDNLRLALAVRDQLQGQGINVLMTRSTDEFISLQDRASIANEAGADLFVSLHRNSYTEQTPMTNGVENYIYLTAPQETTGRAAQLVLDEVAKVGVQSNRGVNRGNYYVLRKTAMPAMLLEMGYIINDEDNRLFDENLDAYAQGIAKGVLAYFGVPWSEAAVPVMAMQPGEAVLADEYIPVAGGSVVPDSGRPFTPRVFHPQAAPPDRGPSSATAAQRIIRAKQALNEQFGLNLPLNPTYDPLTRQEITRLFQEELNACCEAGLVADGFMGASTQNNLPQIGMGSSGNAAFLVQCMLLLEGYDPGPVDGIFDERTAEAVKLFQIDHYLRPSGVAGWKTLTMLLVA